MRIKNRVIKYLIAAWVLLYAIPGSSSVAFYHFDTDNGLPETNIISISQDSAGFIWLAGENSLTRFDGHQFRSYENREGTKLPWNRIHTIFTDSEGILWIGTDNGFFYHNFWKDQFVAPASGLEGISVSDFSEDHQGNLWISTENGLAHYNKETKEFSRIIHNTSEHISLPPALATLNIKLVCNDSDGTVWFVTQNNKLFYFNHQNYDIKPLEKIGDIRTDELYITQIDYSDGFLFLSTESNGLIRYDPQKDTTRNYIAGYPANTIYQFHIANDSVIWLATGAGLYRMNRQTSDFTQFTNVAEDPLSMESTTIKYVFIDEEENIWVSYGLHGIDYGVDNTIFRHFMYSDEAAYNLSQKEVVCIYFDKSGDLWTGYESGLLERHSSNPLKKTKYFLYTENQNSGSAFRVTEDSDSRIWAGGWQSGLQLFNPAGFFEPVSGKPDSLSRLLRQASIFDIEEGPENNLWISTNGMGIIKYNPQSKQIQFFQFNESSPESGISDDYATDLCIDQKNNLWIATSYGLSRLNLTNENFTGYFHAPRDSLSLSGNNINAVHCDKSGNIWAGTTNGLNFYIPESDQFLPIRTDFTHAFSDISAIESVNQGEIWVSTKSGLFCLTYIQNAETKDLKYEIEYFYDTNGLLSNSFLNRSSATENDKLIFFGGNNGIDFFNPAEKEKMQFEPPKAKITDISVFGKPVYPQLANEKNNYPQLQLDYDQRMVSFRYTSVEFTNPKQQKFRYRLEGFDDEWIFPEKERIATYTNLQPGNYIFRVETTDKNGKWSNSDSVVLKVIPPFWRTLPFIILAGLFLAIVFYIAQRLRFRTIRNRAKEQEKIIQERTRELVSKNQELVQANQTKNKFFSIISHDLRGPFSGLVGILDVLTDSDYNIDNGKHNELLQTAKKSADNTFELLENLLTWARSQMEKTYISPKIKNLSKILQNNIELKQTSAQQKEITIYRDFPENIKAFFDADMISTVTRNLLSNALKYTPPGGEITVSAESKNGFVTVHIADTGIGINDEEMSQLFSLDKKCRNGTQDEKGTGLGLIICKEFVERNYGKIWVTPNHPKGSVFHFSIPLQEI